MISVRKRECLDFGSLAGEEEKALGVEQTRKKFNRTAKEDQPFLKKYWNKHHPDIFFPPIHHKKRPPLLEKAKARCGTLYENPFIYALGKQSFNPEKINKKGGYRKVRAESRSFLFNILYPCILHHVDFKTLKYGYMADGRFINYGILKLFHQIQKSLKESNPLMFYSYPCYRKHLKKAEQEGFIIIEKRKERRNDGTYKNLPSIIRVNPELFYHLGFNPDDMHKAEKQENHFAFIEQLNVKKAAYSHNQKEKKKHARVYQNKIRETLNKYKSGATLTPEEKNLLDKEQKGYDRKNESPCIYRDYTGISSQKNFNREDATKQSVGSSHISSILSKLKYSPP